tara:strand:- start:846 stop:1097 length:252 start_codon:yes stop_codon:yes gene_type:complete
MTKTIDLKPQFTPVNYARLLDRMLIHAVKGKKRKMLQFVIEEIGNNYWNKEKNIPLIEFPQFGAFSNAMDRYKKEQIKCSIKK